MGAFLRDIDRVVQLAESIVPASLAGATDGEGVDTNFANGVRSIIHIGSIATTLDVEITDSDDDGDADAYALVENAQVHVTEGDGTRTEQTTGAFDFDAIGLCTITIWSSCKRWVRVEATPVGGDSVSGAVIEVYDSKTSPNPL